MTTDTIRSMNSLLAITSIDRAAQQLTLAVPTVRRMMSEQGIQPAASVNGIIYISDVDLERLREAMAMSRKSNGE